MSINILKSNFYSEALGGFFLLLLVTLLIGCSSYSSDDSPALDGLMSISVTSTNLSMPVGIKRQLTATGIFEDGTSSDITALVRWTSSTPDVATIDASALAVGLAPGHTFAIAAAGDISASTTLTVTTATLSSILTTVTNPNIPVGLHRQITATGAYSDGTFEDITHLAVWSSDAVSTAFIDIGGLATGIAVGTAVINADFGEQFSSTTLNITAAILDVITITPANPSVVSGLRRQFTATGIFSDGTSEDITTKVLWSSEATSVVTFNPSGVANSGLATGISAGSSTITATLNGHSDRTTLTVTAASLDTISVMPMNRFISSGMTQQFAAIGNYSDGSVADITTSVLWSSGTTSVATLNPSGAANSGLASGISAGSSIITAALNGHSGSTTLTVTTTTTTTPTGPSTLDSITVTPANSSVVSGLTRQFTATGIYSNGTSADITASVVWSSGTTGVATLNPSGAANSGLATGISAGSSTITATVGERSGSATLTVAVTSLESISVTPLTPSIVSGTAQQFAATGSYSDGSVADITTSVVWSSGTTSVATLNPSGAANSGLATGVSAGSSTITATLAGRSGSTALTVTATSSGTLDSITVTPVNPRVVNGLTRQFTATGIFSDGTSNDITASVLWSSGTSSVATLNPSGTASSGLATGVSAGSSTITATLGERSGSTTLTVTSASLDSITVTPVNPSVVNGLTRQFTATGIFSDGTSDDITASVLWSSGTTSVATLNPSGAANSGLATGFSAGSSTITATLGERSGSTTLTVTSASLDSITVTPVNPIVVNGLTRQFTATGSYSDGSVADITSLVLWSSGMSSVATLNPSGTANSGLATGVSAGNSTITATLDGRSGSTTLTVTSASLDTITITPVNPSVVSGLTRQFTATGIFSDGTSENITTTVLWSSGTTSVATLNPSGTASSGLASGVSAGSSTITATLDGRSGSTTLTVTVATLDTITVTPANPSVVSGLTRQFTATGSYSDGSVADITASVLWSSGTTSVATLNPSGTANSGLATGVSAGSSTITATLAGRSGSTALTVTTATLDTIAVTPTNPSVVNGLTRQFAATGNYSDGSVADITATVLWSSGTTSVATLNPSGAANSGLATAVSAGSSTITATLAGRSGSTTLTVTAASLDSITVTPVNPSVMSGLTQQFVATGSYSDGSVANITTSVIWSSGTTSVATLNPSGAVNSGLATAVSPGSSTITATLGDRSGSTTLTVTEALENNPTPPSLGETARFVIVASQAVTTTTGTAISNGDMAILDQARTYYAGFTIGATAGSFTELVNGISFAPDDSLPVYAVPAPYSSMVAFINQIRTDLGNVYSFLAADPNPGALTQICPTELGNLTLTRGVYKTASNVTLQTGNLTLDAQGDPDSVWIFSIAGSLTTGAPGGNINLINGAQAKNVYWRIGTSTVLATNTVFEGNIFSWAQVNLFTGARVTGRLFSVTEQVTLDANMVTKVE